jgi:mono/diheme cytochrome c family protein
MTKISGARAAIIGGLLLATVGRAVTAQQPARSTAAMDSITPAQIALGDSVFHGRAGGGTCAVCHGQDAKGTTGLAPDLTDAKWLHGDGSYAFIVGIVQQGVPNPKESPAPMPPLGGASLTPDQVRAVAAYVYSLATHAKGRRGP